MVLRDLGSVSRLKHADTDGLANAYVRPLLSIAKLLFDKTNLS